MKKIILDAHYMGIDYDKLADLLKQSYIELSGKKFLRGEQN